MPNETRPVYRELSAEEKHQIESVKEIGQEFIDLIRTLPPNREFSLAITNAEQAVMWAVKGITG